MIGGQVQKVAPLGCGVHGVVVFIAVAGGAGWAGSYYVA